MSARVRIALWTGCALVAALELPRSGAQLLEDLGRARDARAVGLVAGAPEAGSAELEVAATVLHDASPHEQGR